MSKFALYCKFELIYLLSILILIPFPLGLFYQYSEFKAPGLSYTLIGVLFIFQYFFYQPKMREEKLWGSVAKMMERKLGKIPSHKFIQSIVIQISGFRIISIIVTSFIILILSAIYNRLTLF